VDLVAFKKERRRKNRSGFTPGVVYPKENIQELFSGVSMKHSLVEKKSVACFRARHPTVWPRQASDKK